MTYFSGYIYFDGKSFGFEMVSDCLLTRDISNFSSPPIDPLLFLSSRKIERARAPIGYASKVQEIGSELLLVWAGETPSCDKVSKKLKEYESASGPVAAVSELQNIVLSELNAIERAQTNLLAIAAKNGEFKYSVHNLKMRKDGPVTWFRGGSGINFIERCESILAENRIFFPEEKLTSTNRTDLEPHGLRLRKEVSSMLVAEGIIPTFEEFRTGGFFEVTIHTADGFRKLPIWYHMMDMVVDGSGNVTDIEVVRMIAGVHLRNGSYVGTFDPASFLGLQMQPEPEIAPIFSLSSDERDLYPGFPYQFSPQGDQHAKHVALVYENERHFRGAMWLSDCPVDFTDYREKVRKWRSQLGEKKEQVPLPNISVERAVVIVDGINQSTNMDPDATPDAILKLQLH